MPARTPKVGPRSPFPFGFPLRDVARTAWRADELATLSAERGRPFAVRELARRAAAAPLTDREGLWRTGELLALTLLAEVQRALIGLYCDVQQTGVLAEAIDWLEEGQPGAPVAVVLEGFGAAFPDTAPLAVEPGVAELINVRMLVENPAATPYVQLFDDAPLTVRDQYPALIETLEAWFDTRAPFTGAGLTLFGLLRAPAKAHPHSLRAQLAYIREHFGRLLPSWLMAELVVAGDVLAEEEAARGFGPGPAEPLTFTRAEHDAPEHFTPDRDWMSNVVLLAKQTYVWLDQLTRTYGYPITRLDQIPDAELDRLARFGFTSLWLIGVWERSTASRTIKQWRGNPEALASAYSLYDYTTAYDLGGDAAWWDLDRRCRARGIRLATDMVPNHTGLDSRWIVEHPDYFLQLDHPPYPSYRFTGADLAPDPAVSVHLEDGYWNHSDAAVTFKLYDHRDGRTRYIYHGNDGTSMPWNDTAQIDYLNPQAREAVIQKILHVARMSSVIRFDAAMTLARQHVQRLWYPKPGHGGAIPSRAEYALTEADFDRLMPVEFWREVVDRIQAEVPDTLLLAEAFWLMEGYFVRTLGMHRVYNSAFMHMLRDEDNAKYRQTLKNVLDLSAEVLKRFVNFMNNPDEETAVEQFGKGDKYFGVALLLVTLPGLPMVGHGQVEGFSEKYGMEYRKAYKDEHVDDALVARHAREIFPVMRLRHVFSHADHFALYDLGSDHGGVNEDVYAYSNRAGAERALIVFHNAFRETSGWIRQAAPTRRGGSDAPLTAPTLISALDFAPDAGLIAFREQRSGLWYLRWSRELAERGLHLALRAYESKVFLDFQIVPAHGAWLELAQSLGERGVADPWRAVRNLELRGERDAFRRVVADAPADGDDVALVLTLGPNHGAALDAARDTLVAGLARLERLTLPTGTRTLGRALVLLRALPTAVAEGADLYALTAEVSGEAGDAGLLRQLVALSAEAPVDLPGVTAAPPFDDFATLVEGAEGPLGVHLHDGVRWFKGEAMEAIVRGWMLHRTISAPATTVYRAPIDALLTQAAYHYDDLLVALGRRAAPSVAPVAGLEPEAEIAADLAPEPEPADADAEPDAKR